MVHLFGKSGCSVWTSSSFSLFRSSEVGDFGVADGGDVAAGDQELHDLGAFTGEGAPTRGGCGVLLEGADALAGEVEIDLGELALGGGKHGIGIVAQDYALFAFDLDLTPYGEQGFVQAEVFVFFGHWAKKIAYDGPRPLQRQERSLCSLAGAKARPLHCSCPRISAGQIIAHVW
jgi:hypothetical protein